MASCGYFVIGLEDVFPCMPAADWAAWAGVGGAIAAVVFTIVLWRLDRGKAIKDEVDAAREQKARREISAFRQAAAGLGGLDHLIKSVREIRGIMDVVEFSGPLSNTLFRPDIERVASAITDPDVFETDIDWSIANLIATGRTLDKKFDEILQGRRDPTRKDVRQLDKRDVQPVRGWLQDMARDAQKLHDAFTQITRKRAEQIAKESGDQAASTG